MPTLARTLLLAALVLALPGFAPARAADAPTLADRRDVRIDGTRIIALSPDGARIAAAASDFSQLCVYDAATLAQQACADLAPLEAGLRIGDVAWSPDSTKLALAEQSFVRFVDGDLWLMDAATGDLTNLTDDGVNARIPFGDDTDVDFDALYLDVSPTWRPDGSGVTFSRTTWRKGAGLTGNVIVTVPVTGGEPTLVARVSPDIPGVVYFPMRWTAEGSQLIYSYNGTSKDDPDNGIWRVNADGSGQTKLLGPDPQLGQVTVGGVSPDGRTVLAYYAQAAMSFAGQGPFYALLDTATGKTTPLALNDADALHGAFVRTAALTPDGRYVLYATRLTDPDVQVWLRPVAGGADIPLVPDGLPDAFPVDANALPAWSDAGALLLDDEVDAATLLAVDGVSAPAAAPASPAATPAIGVPAHGTPPATAPTTFAPGDAVTVNDNDVPLRAAPGTDAQTVAILARGTALTVVAAPVHAGGFVWVPVTDPATGTLSYVRAEFLDPPTE